MSAKELVALGTKNTLSEIMIQLKKHISNEDFGSLNMFHRTFMMTLRFLPEIWNRILEDAELDITYWKVYVDLYEPGAVEREPTTKERGIISKWPRHRFRLNLDVEDWIIHSHILMDKFAKFAKRLMFLISRSLEERNSANDIPDKSFHKHQKFFLDHEKQEEVVDIGYAEIIRQYTTWYAKELKNTRDDLIQHEAVPKFWGYDVSGNGIRLSRFRLTQKLIERLYALRDQYASVYPELKEETNLFTLLSIFERHGDKLKKGDITTIRNVRKSYGDRFPDIPTLFHKISDFLSRVNNHFISEIPKRFE